MFIFLTTSLCLLGLTLQGADAVSNCHMREMDLCLATIVIAASEGVPGNDDDMDKVCEPVQEGFECIGNYSVSCLTPLMQEVFDMVIAEPQKVQKQMCTRGTEERTKYLKNAPCFQKVLSTDNVKPHMEDLLAALEKATEAEFQQRIPIMCCGIQRMYKAAVDMVEAECGKDILEEGSALIGLSVTSLSDMFCRGYEPESDKCHGILPPSGAPFKGVDSENQLIRFISSALANFT